MVESRHEIALRVGIVAGELAQRGNNDTREADG